jgi:hypothetical protein
MIWVNTIKKKEQKKKNKGCKRISFWQYILLLGSAEASKLHSIIPFFPYNSKLIDSTNIYVPPLFFQGSNTSPEPQRIT